MSKPKQQFEYTGPEVKCDCGCGETFFTKGKVYDTYDVGGGRFVVFDNDNENHGMSKHQMDKWFKEVEIEKA